MAAVENYAGNPATPFPFTRAPAPTSVTSLADRELVAKVRRMYEDARTHRRNTVQKWTENYMLLRNRTRPSNWPTQVPFPEIPEIWPIVESLIGWLCDTRPTLDVAPTADPYSTYYQFMSQLADNLRTALQANWQMNDHEAQTELFARDAFIYGTGITKTYWDNSRVQGLGDAIIRRVDPYAFYPDPATTYMAGPDTDGNYFIEARRVSPSAMDEHDRRSLSSHSHRPPLLMAC